MLRVPVLTPRLSSLWLGLVTPLYAGVGRELIDGVRNETVVRDTRALQDFAVRPRGVREALARALVNEDLSFAATRWSDALSSRRMPRSWGGVPVRIPPGGFPGRVGRLLSAGGISSHRPDRRQGRMVLRGPPLAAARFSGSAGRGNRDATGTPGPRHPSSR